MTFSIELLPAPLGPMIARTSCSRTSKLMSVSALTPPNASDTCSSASTTSPIRRSPMSSASGRARDTRREHLRVGDHDVGGDDAAAPVLELHLGLDVLDLARGVQRVDQRAVLLGDEPAADLARARQLVVVRIELLVQEQKAAHLGVGEAGFAGEFGVDLLDAVADQRVHLGLCGEIAVARVSESAPLGPVADRSDIDVDERADAVAPVAERDGLTDVREELQLVLDVVRREYRSARELADVLRAIDDPQLARGIEHAGVAGMKVAFTVDRLGGRVGPLVVLLQQHRAAQQHFAALRDADLDPR